MWSRTSWAGFVRAREIRSCSSSTTGTPAMIRCDERVSMSPNAAIAAEPTASGPSNATALLKAPAPSAARRPSVSTASRTPVLRCPNSATRAARFSFSRSRPWVARPICRRRAISSLRVALSWSKAYPPGPSARCPLSSPPSKHQGDRRRFVSGLRPIFGVCPPQPSARQRSSHGPELVA